METGMRYQGLKLMLVTVLAGGIPAVATARGTTADLTLNCGVDAILCTAYLTAEVNIILADLTLGADEKNSALANLAGLVLGWSSGKSSAQLATLVDGVRAIANASTNLVQRSNLEALAVAYSEGRVPTTIAAGSSSSPNS